MQRAVENLPERRCLVYKIVRQQGMSYADVASASDVTKKTLENQMGRALNFLRGRLSPFKSVFS